MSNPRAAVSQRLLSWRVQAASTAVCAASTLGGWAVHRWAGPPEIASALAVLAYAAGGWDAARRSARALSRGRMDVDLLMLLAATGAAVVGEWIEGAILLFLFSLGNTLETFAFGRTRRSIESLMRLRPDTASHVSEDGSERIVAVATLSPGMRVRVRPGERVVVDGIVRSGRSSVDESTLTGEPDPARKAGGSEVFAGTLNGGGSLEVEVTRGPSETTLARMIRLVEDAREARSETQGWIERVEGRYDSRGDHRSGACDGAACALPRMVVVGLILPGHDPAGGRLSLRPGHIHSTHRRIGGIERRETWGSLQGRGRAGRVRPYPCARVGQDGHDHRRSARAGGGAPPRRARRSRAPRESNGPQAVCATHRSSGRGCSASAASPPSSRSPNTILPGRWCRRRSHEDSSPRTARSLQPFLEEGGGNCGTGPGAHRW